MANTEHNATAWGRCRCRLAPLWRPDPARGRIISPSARAPCRPFHSQPGAVKCAAAQANAACGALDEDIGAAIAAAAAQVAAAPTAGQFPVGVFQTGSGTSTNMNMNEVLARLASDAQRPGGAPQRSCKLQPEQQRRDSQLHPGAPPPSRSSSNCTGAARPGRSWTAGRGAVVDHRQDRPHPPDGCPADHFWPGTIWPGLTSCEECEDRLDELQPRLRALPLGGSAVGTGVNVPDWLCRARSSGCCRSSW